MRVNPNLFSTTFPIRGGSLSDPKQNIFEIDEIINRSVDKVLEREDDLKRINELVTEITNIINKFEDKNLRMSIAINVADWIINGVTKGDVVNAVGLLDVIRFRYLLNLNILTDIYEDLVGKVLKFREGVR